MSKLICVVMGQDCEQTIGMCLESVKDADAIVYLDGGSTDNTKDIVTHFDVDHYVDEDDPKFISDEKALIRLENKFDKSDPNMISKQRNFYLDYLKQTFNSDDWVLVLDADEVIDDLSEIKEGIKKTSMDAYQVKMRHLMYTLSYEDATQEQHWVLKRLFRLGNADNYPEGEHSVLKLKNEDMVGFTDHTTIWHLGYLGGVWDVKKRYDQQKLRDNGHTPEFLDSWNKTHMLGKYPVKPINPVELPKVILENFGIDSDELYFADRGLQTNHFIDACHWRDFFRCEKVLEWGCGLGPRVYALMNMGVVAVGLEISDYAVKNRLISTIEKADITIRMDKENTNANLVVAYDVLEHVPYDKLDTAINNLIDTTNKHILVSVPVLGDPNLEADPTHVIKETKEWWKKQFTSKGLKEVEVPEHFLFRDQLMIFEKLPNEWEKTDYDISKKIAVGANVK